MEEPSKRAKKREGNYADLPLFGKIWTKALQETPEYDPRILRRYAPASKEVYGEVCPSFVAEIIDKVKLTARDVFYDLGSGVGNVVIQVAAQTGCRAVGVEIREDLQRIATRLQASCVRRAKKKGCKSGPIHFINGDVITVDFSAATVVFVNNYCFPAVLEEKILERFKKVLKTGARVISLKNFRPRFRPHSSRYRGDPCLLFQHPWAIYSTRKDSVSWTDKSVNYFVYMVNKDNLKEQKNEKERVTARDGGDGYLVNGPVREKGRPGVKRNGIVKRRWSATDVRQYPPTVIVCETTGHGNGNEGRNGNDRLINGRALLVGMVKKARLEAVDAIVHASAESGAVRFADAKRVDSHDMLLIQRNGMAPHPNGVRPVKLESGEGKPEPTAPVKRKAKRRSKRPRYLYTLDRRRRAQNRERRERLRIQREEEGKGDLGTQEKEGKQEPQMNRDKETQVPSSSARKRKPRQKKIMEETKVTGENLFNEQPEKEQQNTPVQERQPPGRKGKERPSEATIIAELKKPKRLRRKKRRVRLGMPRRKPTVRPTQDKGQDKNQNQNKDQDVDPLLLCGQGEADNTQEKRETSRQMKKQPVSAKPRRSNRLAAKLAARFELSYLCDDLADVASNATVSRTAQPTNVVPTRKRQPPRKRQMEAASGKPAAPSVLPLPEAPRRGAIQARPKRQATKLREEPEDSKQRTKTPSSGHSIRTQRINRTQPATSRDGERSHEAKRGRLEEEKCRPAVSGSSSSRHRLRDNSEEENSEKKNIVDSNNINERESDESSTNESEELENTSESDSDETSTSNDSESDNEGSEDGSKNTENDTIKRKHESRKRVLSSRYREDNRDSKETESEDSDESESYDTDDSDESSGDSEESDDSNSGESENSDEGVDDSEDKERRERNGECRSKRKREESRKRGSTSMDRYDREIRESGESESSDSGGSENQESESSDSDEGETREHMLMGRGGSEYSDESSEGSQGETDSSEREDRKEKGGERTTSSDEQSVTTDNESSSDESCAEGSSEDRAEVNEKRNRNCKRPVVNKARSSSQSKRIRKGGERKTDSVSRQKGSVRVGQTIAVQTTKERGGNNRHATNTGSKTTKKKAHSKESSRTDSGAESQISDSEEDIRAIPIIGRGVKRKMVTTKPSRTAQPVIKAMVRSMGKQRARTRGSTNRVSNGIRQPSAKRRKLQ